MVFFHFKPSLCHSLGLDSPPQPCLATVADAALDAPSTPQLPCSRVGDTGKSTGPQGASSTRSIPVIPTKNPPDRNGICPITQKVGRC